MADEPGIKFDLEKPRFSLVPFEALEQAVWVLMAGAEKYEPDNWKRIEDGETRYSESAMRHMVAVMKGVAEGKRPHEVLDPDFGTPALAHVICCCLFALWFARDELPDKYDLSGIREKFAVLREEYRRRVATTGEGLATRGSATGDLET